MEKLKQDSEIAIAKNVQQALLPKSLPDVGGYNVFASYDTALAVGGDYYDVILLDDDKKICLSFGDVAGKGIPASLVMSRISSVVQSTLNHVDDVGEAVTAINNHMCRRRRGPFRDLHPGHHRHGVARNAARDRRAHVPHDS